MTGSETEGPKRKRAVIRLILGQLQIMGASAGVYLLLTTRVSSATMIVVGVTLLVSIWSRLIFARWSHERGADKASGLAKPKLI